MANRQGELLSLAQVAELFQVTPEAVRKFIYSGRLRSTRTPEGEHLVRESDVDVFLFTGPRSKEPVSRDDLIGMIAALVGMIEQLHDSFHPGHAQRVAESARRLSESLGLDVREQERIWLGGLVHDVGKLMVDPLVLRKKGRLTDDEVRQVRAHPVHGEQVLERFDELQDVSGMVRYHHERCDGKGYPDGLHENDTPLAAQIIALAEAYESMRSEASYRAALSHEQAEQELRENAGTCYNRDLVKAFLSVTN